MAGVISFSLAQEAHALDKYLVIFCLSVSFRIFHGRLWHGWVALLWLTKLAKRHFQMH